MRTYIWNTRKRQAEKDEYYASLKAGGCIFCRLPNTGNKIVATTEHFYVIVNMFPYDWFDMHDVITHYLLIPKRHILTFKEFNQSEIEDYYQIVSDYESRGFSIYTRSSTNKSRSVSHFHTHLIKTGDKKYGTFIILIGKLGIRIVK